MIRYALRCAEGHSFDSWFASGAELDRLQGAALLSCAVCGDARVEKDLMAPRVRTAGGELTGPASASEQALAELRRRVEATSENVGRDFPDEARRIHAGEAEARPIIGEARPSEARALIDEGIPIAQLPWSRDRKTN
ncbi:DUF1178 family protein [Amaricoccus sp.]|uniref:DUF1178 family protein n=1 Tax=Amaricoccus sp. TaxID=1872485 RepID=UPI001B4C84AC|nr:DUF1178 family protein [Amaricoccus sp.]MBP7243114.1 DUF1178 family protein [Amaricoccus sp.]